MTPKQIIRIRARTGLTQSGFGELLAERMSRQNPVSKSCVYKWEAGMTKPTKKIVSILELIRDELDRVRP